MSSPLPFTISIVRRSGLRSWNWIGTVAFEAESGATTLPTFVSNTGARSSFRLSVTAKAAAVQPRRANTTTAGRMRPTRVASLVGSRGRLRPRPPPRAGDQAPGAEGEAGDDRAARDHVVRAGEVDQLDAAQHQHGGEPEPERAVGHLERELARDQHSGDRSGQQPRHRPEVDVARHEVPEAGDPKQRGRVEDVGAD